MGLVPVSHVCFRQVVSNNLNLYHITATGWDNLGKGKDGNYKHSLIVVFAMVLQYF